MKLIINADPQDFICAIKCARWLIEHPESNEALLVMSEAVMGTSGKLEVAFYVRRTKTGISVSKTDSWRNGEAA